MTPFDFGLSIFAGILANRYGERTDVSEDEPLKKVKIGPRATTFDREVDERGDPSFKTFDVIYDLERLTDQVADPLVHILIEDQPSTAYRLPSVVLTSRLTGEWYVFSRGRMSFEGSHGGWNNSVGVISFLKERQIPIATWILDAKELADFDDGKLKWLDVWPQLVPLMAAETKDFDWKYIQDKSRLLVAHAAKSSTG